jgi:hypothetical protein
MVLAYLGISRTQESLARMMGVVIPVGVPSSRIKKLASLKITVTYQQGTLDDIHDWLNQDVPVIVFLLMSELPHWRGQELQHAVVIVGLDDQNVYLMDPALETGPTLVPVNDFMLAWDEMDNSYATLTG